MKLDISCRLPCELGQAKKAVKTLALLNYVAAPIMQFESVETLAPDITLKTRSYIMKTKLFGLLPLGLHTMNFSYQEGDGKFAMRDDGHSKLCKKWDHRMTFQESEHGLQYRDRAEIKAGVFTPLIWLFALCFYRHRQNRWILLAKHNFQDLNTGIE